MLGGSTPPTHSLLNNFFFIQHFAAFYYDCRIAIYNVDLYREAQRKVIEFIIIFLSVLHYPQKN